MNFLEAFLGVVGVAGSSDATRDMVHVIFVQAEASDVVPCAGVDVQVRFRRACLRAGYHIPASRVSETQKLEYAIGQFRDIRGVSITLYRLITETADTSKGAKRTTAKKRIV